MKPQRSDIRPDQPRPPWAWTALRLGGACALGLAFATANVSVQAACTDQASLACYQSFEMPQRAGRVHYYASRTPAAESPAAPTRALVALHGHPRDANKTFDAALLAVQRAGAGSDTLVVAPVFQVAAADAARCSTPGVPQAQPGDLLWTCSSWLEGGPARNGAAPTSFAVMDALVEELARQWPSLRSITIAGFSAGAQMVQHYIGFAQAPAPGQTSVRYVVADPGTWLYFDPVRPQPMRAGQPVDWASCANASGPLGDCSLALREPPGNCPAANRWKYGTDGMPASWGRTALQARQHYAAADIHYLEGERDSSDAKGTFYGILDKSCAAAAQGPYRLQRGLGYLYYDNTLLAPTARRTLQTVPGCAHDVACVFPSEAARSALLGPP